MNCSIPNNRFWILLVFVSLGFSSGKKDQVYVQNELPNIILVMADDLGWGDVAYNGNTIVKTPHLDEMAKNGIQLNRFYAAAPVCSPTRASCLTGRHPYRVKIPWAGDGYIAKAEITIAEALKTKNYATGHFGKWHVGGLSKTVKQSYFPGPPTTYSPPWENGFDVSFSTESMMPTYNPYYQVGGIFGSEEYRYIQSEPIFEGQKSGGFKWQDFYWTGENRKVKKLVGDDAELVMNKALDFIQESVENGKSFLSVIWFHNVHTPVAAGEKHRKLYPDLTMEGQHWYGGISAMDEQIGRLRKQLKKIGAKDNTILWFCSDNGPSYIHNYNSAGPYRGKKSELFEGGIIVPSIVEWPAKFKTPTEIDIPMVTSDFYPTLLNICNIKMENQPILDGEDVLPILIGKQKGRKQAIGFRSPLPNRLNKQETKDAEQLAWINDTYKVLTVDNGNSFQLYDLTKNLAETSDLSAIHPEIKKEMVTQLKKWSASIDKELKK